jgi:hypothetical protein
MTSQPRGRVKELLHQAMQLTPEEHAGFLDQACPSDAALRAEVESLLLADEGVRSSFMQSPPPSEPGGDGAGKGQIDSAGGNRLETGRLLCFDNHCSVATSTASFTGELHVLDSHSKAL